MKKLVIVAAIAAAVSAPAFAQSTSRANQANNALNTQTLRQQPAQARHSNNPAYDVYSSQGHYVGSDPDPQVRTMLRVDEGYND